MKMEVNATESQKAKQQSTAISPALVDTIGTASVVALSQLLNGLYEQIDDTLFDLADRAYNNNEQALYFESMREIRSHREGCQQVFKQSLENAFQRLRNKETTGVSHKELEAETLALVDNEEMEVDVALNAMVHRARCEFPAALLQLTTRLNSFLPKHSATEDSNPLDPKQIVRAFDQATQNLQLNIKVRLILLKEFELQVLKKLDEVLYDANQILINAGVLPDIRATMSRQNKADQTPTEKPDTHSSTQGEPQTSQEPAFDNAPQQVHFDTLQSLLAATTNLQEASVYIQSDPNKPSLDQSALFDWLSNIQQDQVSDSSDGAAPPRPVTVRQAVFDKLRALGTDDPNHRLQQVDDNVINVVDMIFEFILEQDIPTPMAALIGRLQIPILKVAIRDQDFFDSHLHPARRLLNEIAHAALGWDANSNYSNDPLYQKVETIVKTILKAEHPSVELFNKLEKEFHGYMDGETKRSERLAKRTADTEEGRAKTEAAKRQLDQLIQDRIQGKELPPEIIELLQTPWKKYLLQAQLKHGTGSTPWRDALQTTDDLIWSVQMHTDPKARQRWIKMIPSLLEKLREGLQQIAHSSAETEQTMADLWQIHSKMLSHEGNSNPVKTVKVDLTHTANPAPISPLVKRGVAPDTIRALRKQVSAFTVGDWFEFKQVDSTIIRCRLIRKIRANDSFVFANRYGAKAKAITKDQLGLYIHEHKAKKLDSGPLIDRALQAVMLRLKNSLP